MVFNALGFASRALYLTPAFFTKKPVDPLIREGLQAEDLHDESLGCALDRLYKAGMIEVFARVASHALQVYGVQHRFVHLDSMGASLQGEYAPATRDPQAIRLTHGDSKDHRPGLKQAVVALICSYRSAIPVRLAVLSATSADKITFPQTIQAYMAQLQAVELRCFSADSLHGIKSVAHALNQTITTDDRWKPLPNARPRGGLKRFFWKLCVIRDPQ
jgi:transposase